MKRREEGARFEKNNVKLLQLKFNTERVNDSAVSLQSNRIPLQNKGSSLAVCGQSFNQNDTISKTAQQIPSRNPTLPHLQHSTLSYMMKSDRCASAVLKSQDSLVFRHCGSHRVQVIRSEDVKNKNPNRMCLDRCGLLCCPLLIGENCLQLLSMRYNLISNIDTLSSLPSLICLDLHANRIQRIQGLEALPNLRVLLLGKNRGLYACYQNNKVSDSNKEAVWHLHTEYTMNKQFSKVCYGALILIRRIEGLDNCIQLVVLDLQNNLICDIPRNSGLPNLKNLRALNLSGNQIKTLTSSGIQYMESLQELDLQRNQLNNMIDLSGMVALEKLHINSNELQYIDNLEVSLKNLSKLEELSVQGNPLWGNPSSQLLLLNLLPGLRVISGQPVSDDMRMEAKKWVENNQYHGDNDNDTKEQENDDADDEGVFDVIARERSIYNARRRWELIKSQTKRIIMLSRTPFDACAVGSSTSLHKSESNSLKYPRPLLKQHSYSESSPSGYESAVSSTSTESKADSYVIKPLPLHLRNQRLRNRPLTTVSSRESRPKSQGKKIRKPSAPVTKSTFPSINNNETVYPSVNTSSIEDSQNSEKEDDCEHTNYSGEKSTKTRKNHGRKTQEQGNDYLLEMEDDGETLNVIGEGALRSLLRQSSHSKSSHTYTIDTKALVGIKKLQLSYLPYATTASAFAKLKEKLEQASIIELRAVGLSRLTDLNALSDFQGLSSLIIHVDGNPLLSIPGAMKLWEDYACFRLSHWGLVRINDKELCTRDIQRSSEIFNSLGELALWCLPNDVIAPLVARLRQDPQTTEDEDVDDETEEKVTNTPWSFNDDTLLRNVIAKEALTYKPDLAHTNPRLYLEAQNTVEKALDFACDCLDKLIMLEEKWPNFLSEKIQDILVDFVEIEDHKKISYSELETPFLKHNFPTKIIVIDAQITVIHKIRVERFVFVKKQHDSMESGGAK